MHALPISRVWVSLVLFACVVCVGHPSADAAQRQRSIVVIVDASSSMDDIQLDVQNALVAFANNLEIGDQCVIFAFGDQVRQVVARDIASADDRANIVTAIEGIQTTDRFTDITTALERGFRALQRNAAGRPGHLPMLVLLTDGRHNPRNADAAPTFDELREMYGDFVPGEDWYLHYVVLKPDVADPAATAFVHAIRGALTRLDGIGALGESLTAMPTPAPVVLADAVGRCSVRAAEQPGWIPADVDARLTSGMIVETGPDGRAIVRVAQAVRLGLEPTSRIRIEEATWDPLRERGTLRIAIEEGVVDMRTDDTRRAWDVVLQTPHAEIRLTGTRLRLAVAPADGAATVHMRDGAVRVGQPDGAVDLRRHQETTISAAGLAEEPSDWPAAARGRSMAWDAPLDGEALADHGAAFARAAWEALQWEIGPLAADATWSRVALVSLAGLDERALANARALVTGTIPDGIDLTVELVPPASIGPHELQLTAMSAPHYIPEPDAVYSGRIVLDTGGESELATFPLKLWTEATAAAPAVVTTIDDGSGWITIAGFVVGLALIVVFVVGIQKRVGRGRTFTGTGRLLVIENPVPDEFGQDFVGLDAPLQKKRDGKLTIGNSTYCDIVLPHDSVLEHHCNLLFTQTRAGTDVHVETIRDAAVTLNDDPCSGRFRIGDRAQIGIGGFTLQYEDSGAKPQVLVHLKDGKAVRGALHAWDLNEPTFLMAPNDAHVKFFGGPVKGVNFADVQDIAMLRLGGGSARKSQAPVGKTVIVRFSGGRTIDGILWADYDPDAPTFTLFPKNSPEIDYIVVVRANTQSVDTGDEIPDYPDHLIP